MSFAELPDDVLLDHETTPQPTQGVGASDYVAHVKGLIDAGASADDVRAYVKSVGADPSLIGGLDEAISRHGQGLSTDVALQGTAAQQTPVPETPQGFTELPADAPITPDEPDTMLKGLGRGVRDVMSGAGAAADLISAPIAVPLKAIGADIAPYKDIANNLADKLGLPRSETTTQKIVSALDEGGLLGLATAGAGGAMAGAGGVTGAVGQALAATPVADTISSATGNAASEAAKQGGAGAVGQIVAGVAGGGVGALASVGAPAAANRALNSTDPSELLAAFQRQQVQPMAAQIGGFGSRMMSAGAKATLGGLPLAKAAELSIETAKRARDRIARSMGRVTDDTGAGQAIQRGANALIGSTAEKGGKLYEVIPVSGDKLSVLSSTKRALSDLNSGLTSNPELSALISDTRLKGYEKAISGTSSEVPTGILDGKGAPIMKTVEKGGKLSWQDLKSFRSYVGELAGRPTLQDSTSKDALQKLYAGLSDDMRATAASDGPKALAAFNRANTYWRARQGRIDDTLAQILGKNLDKSPEASFAQIEKWSRPGGDSASVARAIRSLPEDEASTVRATIFSRLGNVGAGRQDRTGEVFSPNDFATNWAKLDPRAKSVLFPGQEYRRDLDDIAMIADSMKASEGFANTSRTALANRIGGNLLGATVVGYFLHPLTALGGEGVGYTAGALLSSPRFAKWLASTPKKPVGPATLAHINRLTAIASAEPAIANQVLGMQERLAQAFTAQPLAASRPNTDQNVDNGR